jgi:hypothetical protein
MLSEIQASGRKQRKGIYTARHTRVYCSVLSGNEDFHTLIKEKDI